VLQLSVCALLSIGIYRTPLAVVKGFKNRNRNSYFEALLQYLVKNTTSHFFLAIFVGSCDSLMALDISRKQINGILIPFLVDFMAVL